MWGSSLTVSLLGLRLLRRAHHVFLCPDSDRAHRRFFLDLVRCKRLDERTNGQQVHRQTCHNEMNDDAQTCTTTYTS